MRVLLRVLILCLPLLTIPVIPVHAAAPTPPIYPPASAFVFSQDDIGGPTQMQHVSLNRWPVRPPITATFYEVMNTDFAYEVDVFHSLTDAKTVNNLPFRSDYTLYNVPQPLAPDEHLAGHEDSKNGYYMGQASSIFRNVYLAGFAYVSYSDHPELSKAGVQALARQEALATFARIYGRAMSFAGQPNLHEASPTTGIEPQRLLYPTPGVFAHEPYQVTVGDPQSLPFKNALADYSYQQDPHGIDYDSYEAITFNSVAAAHAYNDATYGSQDNTTGAPPWQSVSVPSPLTPNEHAWVEGDGNPGATCTLVLTLAYGNLVLVSTVADQCAGDSGSPALSPDKVQHATDLLSFLLAHAESYATGAPVSLNAQRNRAFVSLVHDLNGRISRCQSSFAPAYQEFQRLAALMSIGKGNPQHVISLVTLVGQACNAYPFFDSPGMGLPGYTLDQTLVHEASVRHLVYTDVHNALSARDDAALAINRYAQGFERGQAADVLVQYYTAAVKAAQMGLVYDKQVKQDTATIANTWHVNL